ncbi:hypothetical protein CRUP_031390 [Coryphaenoides rupestris]|nr:hypothetical protein CRUP_031390 [Coryphaenoides rupestris]
MATAPTPFIGKEREKAGSEEEEEEEPSSPVSRADGDASSQTTNYRCILRGVCVSPGKRLGDDNRKGETSERGGGGVGASGPSVTGKRKQPWIPDLTGPDPGPDRTATTLLLLLLLRRCRADQHTRRGEEEEEPLPCRPAHQERRGGGGRLL